MNPELILEQLAADGIRLSVSDDGILKASGQPEAVSRWLPILRENKHDIMTAIRSTDASTIEPAEPNARPVFWERADGQICGPATPEFRARVNSGPKTIYLVVAQFLGEPVFINSTALRSKRQFETQPTLRMVEPIREPQ